MDLVVHGGTRVGAEWEVSIPGDKSISQRILIAAAGMPGMTRVVNSNSGLAVALLQEALACLGVEFVRAGDALLVGTISVPAGTTVEKPLYFGPASASARLLLGYLAGSGIGAIFDGDYTLRRRPMQWVVDPLRELGAGIEYLDEPGHLPLRLAPSRLHSGEVEMTVGSAQARSAILLAAAASGQRVKIRHPVHSRDHTERLLSYLGAALEIHENLIEIHGSRIRSVPELSIPSDPSAVAYPLAAHLLSETNGSLSFRGICLNATRTGFIALARSMGAVIDFEHVSEVCGEPVGIVTIGPGPPRLHPFVVDDDAVLHSLIDEVPLACALATRANGRSRVMGAGELVWKETNRLETTCRMLTAFGANVSVEKNGIWVEGGWMLRSGTIPSFGDHRVAMTAASLATALGGISTVEQGGCYANSTPGFVEMMRAGGWSMEERGTRGFE